MKNQTSRLPGAATLLLLLTAPVASATQPMCGTSPDVDPRVSTVHARSRGGSRLMETPHVTLRDGAFYVRNNETITAGHRPFDLAGQSLVFTPSGATAFTLRREVLQYQEPASTPVRIFQGSVGDTWHYATRELPFAMPLFGRSVSRIYITAFNGIHFEEPAEQTALVFDDIEAGVHRGAVLSPLMITTRKPRFLEYPRVYVDTRPDAVVVTWRSTANAPFGYDVQAELRSDGRVTYSYRSVTAMRWGTPILSPGLDPETVSRTSLLAQDDPAGDGAGTVPPAIQKMIDIRRASVSRLRDTDTLAFRIELAEPIDQSKLAEGQVLRFQVQILGENAHVDIDRTAVKVLSFYGTRAEVNGASAYLDGDAIEIYGTQRQPLSTAKHVVRVSSSFRPPSSGSYDSALLSVDFTPAPRTTTRDLSSVAQDTALTLPIAEPFVLGSLSTYAVWDTLAAAHALNPSEWDGVAIYQSFYTDIIFFAGAYATGGNAGVDGIAPYSPFSGRGAARAPTLLHLNQLTYNYGIAEDSASKLMLHEFGHRWLYFFSIAGAGGGQSGRVLNPVSAHPAAYVHTGSAFPVYGPEESSVMGGAFFTPQAEGAYRARASNMGYSWTDLYLMGLAAPEEVPPWFYIAGTNLPLEYWPADGAVAAGVRHDVKIEQVVAVHGKRNPSAAVSEKAFRVLFVLVTESGQDPTAEEVAKLNQWRAVMRRNFSRATGGRATISTNFVVPAKKRSLRH